jgi:hypothetical protein
MLLKLLFNLCVHKTLAKIGACTVRGLGKIAWRPGRNPLVVSLI